MIAPPILDSDSAILDYLRATKAKGGGVVQATLQRYRKREHMQAQLNHEWGIFFTPEQQEAIVIEYTVLRLSR